VPIRALIVGWFSWEQSDSTAGDFLAADQVREWLSTAGIPFDTAVAPPFAGGVNLRDVDAADYPLVIFVCGPFMRNHWEREFLDRFDRSFVCGVNLSLPLPLNEWQPFDFLVERDSDRAVRPDLVFATRQTLVPVVGKCLGEPYDEADVPSANRAIDRLVASREMAVVPIDTRLDVNAAGLRSPAEVESALARMDAVITTRLHGMVLALKNGVPALVVDPEPSGGRIARQADCIGWPYAFTVDALDDAALREAFECCLTSEARVLARRCAERAASRVLEARMNFYQGLETAHARLRDGEIKHLRARTVRDEPLT
jgi:hypothetical protein